nr:long-chain fatty acid--CoA ligase [Chloroflexota bacterium]
MDDKPWLKNYDVGVPHTLAPYPNIPLFQFLEDAARKYPNNPCTHFKGAVITYRQMNDYADQIAAGLAGLGVRKGQPVGIFMPNTPQFVMCYYGILKAGGVVVATNPLYTPREMEHQFNDAGVEVVLVMSNFYNRVNEVRTKTKVKTLVVTNIKETLPPALRLLFTLAKEKKDGHRVELLPGDVWLKDWFTQYKPSDRPQVTVSGDDVAMFQYSGGTTGLSKAAAALHRNIVANTLQIRAWLTDLKEAGEITLMAIPLFHVYGMVAGMSFTVCGAGAMVMIPNPRDLHDVLSNINRYHPTVFPGVPTMYNAINNHPDVKAGKVNLSTIRACISGSAPLLLDIKTKFEALTGGKLVEGFGLSEAPTASHCNPFHGKVKPGSIGLPLPDMEAKIVSLDDGETMLGQGEVGELILRGPQVMFGYHNMPTETANTLRRLGEGDPWLFTGDIATMDEDGFFFIVDRKKELIKAGGYQVWPREIEEVLAGHPKIMEVAAAGVPHPAYGETVKAWVVLRPAETATADELRVWCQDKLAKFKVPHEIEFRTELPKTTVGKVLRRELVRQHKDKAKS